MKSSEWGYEVPYSSSECEFEIIVTEGVVVDCGINDFFQQLFIAEEVFCDAQPKTEELIM